jgi:uncharacterized protein YecT (DUF1311 family)
MILMAVAMAAAWRPPLCPDGATQQCALRDFTKAERANSLAFVQAKGRVRSCKPVDSTRCYNQKRAIFLLETEQRTWRAWRDAHCDVVTFGVEETSAETMVRADCRTELTVKRTKDLQKVGRR